MTRTAIILTYTPASDEPRVVRQARALCMAGWRVVVIGLAGRAPVPEAWTFVELPAADGAAPKPLDGVRQRIGRKLARDFPATAPLRDLAAGLCHGGLPRWRLYDAAVKAAARRLGSVDLVIAHDYPTCPAAEALARAFDAKWIVDSHEYMLAASDDPAWRAHERPFVAASQARYFPAADLVMTVSRGIADHLSADYTLQRAPVVIRSLPFYEALPFRPAGSPLTLLYHGVIDRIRDLDIAVRAAALWRSDARLVIRGPSPEGYAAELETLAASLGAASRVVVEPPAPSDEIIRRANAADVGVFVYRDGSPQRRFVLPNKLFEYVTAGLAVVVSDLPEMTRIVREHGVGLALSEATPEALAAAVDGFTPAAVDAYKRASLAAARNLSWEVESRVFLAAVEDVVGRSGGEGAPVPA
jgi:glycosyltransferase involved in cell wall biosynthesis